MPRFCSECGSRLPENAKFCSECGTRVAAPAPSPDGCASAPREERYDVFLSYSHKDRDEFGMEYIERIKAEIEKSLEDIITDHKPKVFLDAEALRLGDHWHSKIMESLLQCKAVVCLVSEAYLKSEYCTRERLWWNARQTHEGHFLDGPYPVYFVKLEEGIFSERREVKEMMAVQTDAQPWFEVKKKLQEEFICERLASISPAVCKKVRDAELARGSFCSVLPPLNEDFVGRVTELRELHELCVNGKYPVLQAAGGVGKTELSVAYAYGFADQYPMGRFLFRMERVTSWDEAFAKALEMEGTDAQGIPKKVFEELKIDKKELEGKDQGEVHRVAARAFLERAAKGKLLILLDNLDEDTVLLGGMRDFLCGTPISGNIRILATTRGSFNFSEREKFRSYELGNLKEDEAFEMLCLTGNGQYPFDKQPPSGENEEYQAAREVIRFLDGHAWSMEIISAFIAKNYRNGFTFVKELEALRKQKILSISSKTGTYRAGESSTTSAELLRPTLDRLENLELGAETLELAVFAACFDPDEIPLYLLKEYWGRYFSDTVCSCGEPFAYAVNQLEGYHLFRRDADLCRMHRLVQAVFLSRKEKYLPRIIETLSKCPFISPIYWVPLLLQTPELTEACPQDGTLTGKEWLKLLAEPAFAEKCPWQSFSGRDWAEVLGEKPQLADRCDWSKLDGNDWRDLLIGQPQFADRCDWSLLDGSGWAWLLRNQPQFADKCDWSKLDGTAWRRLLEIRPEFANRCDWDLLDGTDWSWLLGKRPEFADHCDWDRLNWEDWNRLFRKQPQFAEHCNWDDLDELTLVSLLTEHPEFVDRCDLDTLESWGWGELLASQPQFADRCDWSLLEGRAWATLLSRQPQFADRCDWSLLDGLAWANLLANQPQFADRCDWSRLDGRAWAELLSGRPQFADECPWSKLRGRDWTNLLVDQPQFVDNCDLNKLRGRDWTKLLEKQPQFADKCNWDSLEGGDWVTLLMEHPQFADRCDWTKLRGDDWCLLLAEHPEWYSKIDISRLDASGLAELIGSFPQFFASCDLSKFNGETWSSLLSKQPQFADRCDWSLLDGGDWASLLEEQPQLADHCDWSLLDGGDWALLLADQPQFAEHCDWSKLDEDDWDDLLTDQPQFADRCDRSKFDEDGLDLDPDEDDPDSESDDEDSDLNL